MYIGRHIYITLTCHALISIISTEYTSSDGPISGEWVLTDVADNTQLGKEERIGDKGTANLVDVDYCLFKVNLLCMWSILLHLFSGYVFRSCIMKDQKVNLVICFTCDFF